MALVSSPVGRALMWTLNVLGGEAAHAAAIAAKLYEDEIDWSDDVAFKGVLGYERLLRRRTELEEDEALRAPTLRIADLASRAAMLETRLGELATLADDGIRRAQNEETLYRAEAVAAWRSLKEQADQAKAALDLDLTALRDGVAGSRLETENNLRGWSDRNEAALRTQAGDNAAALAQALSQGKETLENWIKANVEQRQLAKPARLWAARARSHGRRASALRWWAIAVGVVGLLLSAGVGVGAFGLAARLFADAIVPGAPPPTPGTLRPTFHYQLIFTGLATLAALTMYLWAMRVLVRLYTTEHHLAIDASARGAMNDTYIGLVAAGAANEQDRPIVLAALFRPVQDGIVRDDGPPAVTPAAMLSGMLGASR